MLPTLFKNYLILNRASASTIKNYIADFNNFAAWLGQNKHLSLNPITSSLFLYFTRQVIEEYKTSQIEAKIPNSTVNRRLTTLRRLGQLAIAQGWIHSNPALSVSNVSEKGPINRPQIGIVDKYKHYLQVSKASPSTIKNYLSDLRHFLAWVESKYGQIQGTKQLNDYENNLISLNISPATVKRRLIAIKRFLQWYLASDNLAEGSNVPPFLSDKNLKDFEANYQSGLQCARSSEQPILSSAAGKNEKALNNKFKFLNHFLVCHISNNNKRYRNISFWPLLIFILLFIPFAFFGLGSLYRL